MSTELNDEILQRWLEACRTAGAAFAQRWEPALSGKDLGKVEKSLGHAIPAELRTLWKFGTPDRGSYRRELRQIMPGHELPNPWEVVTKTAEQAALAREEDFNLPPTWTVLVTTESAQVLVIDAADSPVNPVSAFEWDDDPLPVAASVGTLFAWWTRLIEDGDVACNTDGKWRLNPGARDMDEVPDTFSL